jgi:hypothetical protein
MSETFADTLSRFRTLIGDQMDGYRRLLRTTRESNRALAAQDPEAFDRILAEQVEELRNLKRLEGERTAMIRQVGLGDLTDDLRDLQRDLRSLAEEVSRASRASRLVIERNGALVEARLALHRRAGTLDRADAPGVNQFA